MYYMCGMLLSNISKDTVFFHQGVTCCGFPKIVGFNLNKKSLQFDTVKSRDLEAFPRVLPTFLAAFLHR